MSTETTREQVVETTAKETETKVEATEETKQETEKAQPVKKRNLLHRIGDGCIKAGDKLASKDTKKKIKKLAITGGVTILGVGLGGAAYYLMKKGAGDEMKLVKSKAVEKTAEEIFPGVTINSVNFKDVSDKVSEGVKEACDAIHETFTENVTSE